MDKPYTYRLVHKALRDLSPKFAIKVVLHDHSKGLSMELHTEDLFEFYLLPAKLLSIYDLHKLDSQVKEAYKDFIRKLGSH